ncbi:hypothetical protein BT69DRAFT_433431 [Atractiella rhizophila]|nr:hypothetical protein BT69DRAFT_433431 [Atractiella rhizophila]
MLKWTRKGGATDIQRLQQHPAHLTNATHRLRPLPFPPVPKYRSPPPLFRCRCSPPSFIVAGSIRREREVPLV